MFGNSASSIIQHNIERENPISLSRKQRYFLNFHKFMYIFRKYIEIMQRKGYTSKNGFS